MFWRIKIYISLKLNSKAINKEFGFEESKFTYLSNSNWNCFIFKIVLKNQNLHISQTSSARSFSIEWFWRIKIYISLKPSLFLCYNYLSFEESKFTYLSNCSWVSTCSGFEESKFTYLSNQASVPAPLYAVLKNQNLHISQTWTLFSTTEVVFWRIKIYISLKHKSLPSASNKCFEESKFTYLSNIVLIVYPSLSVLKNQNLHISQTFSYFFSLFSCFEESKFTYLSN